MARKFRFKREIMSRTLPTCLNIKFLKKLMMWLCTISAQNHLSTVPREAGSPFILKPFPLVLRANGSTLEFHSRESIKVITIKPGSTLPYSSLPKTLIYWFRKNYLHFTPVPTFGAGLEHHFSLKSRSSRDPPFQNRRCWPQNSLKASWGTKIMSNNQVTNTPYFIVLRDSC